jgi:uncharacterized repeat protein (TIGR03803 family)
MLVRTLTIATSVLVFISSAWAGAKEGAVTLLGDYSTAALISDSAGNLYGTTNFGGEYVNNAVSGTVFELSRDENGGMKQRILYNFTGGADGGYPYASLVFDKLGNLYGTTASGGNLACLNGCGVVFELTPNGDGSWRETVLHTFDGNDGGQPLGPVSFDADGTLYGTTSAYGYLGYNCWSGCGYIFQMKPHSDGNWTFENIYQFQGNEDAGNPQSQLVFDKQGNLYGTAGWNVVFPEVVFELAHSDGSWQFHLLHSFPGCPNCDTFGVLSGVALDSKGNLYGTIPVTGKYSAGFLYELTPTPERWKLNIVHQFTNGNDGGFPFAVPVLDSAGNLYGTTSGGGLQSPNCSYYGCGVAYKFSPSHGGWNESVLYYFKGQNDGGSPEAGLWLDGSADAFGTTYYGGSRGYGVAFRVQQ